MFILNAMKWTADMLYIIKIWKYCTHCKVLSLIFDYQGSSLHSDENSTDSWRFTCHTNRLLFFMCINSKLWYYGHGNGQHWVDDRITGVHTYPWPTCGSQTVHTRYTIVRLIRFEILSAALGYISRAWLEVDLSLLIPHSISPLIIVHVASIPVS